MDHQTLWSSKSYHEQNDRQDTDYDDKPENEDRSKNIAKLNKILTYEILQLVTPTSCTKCVKSLPKPRLPTLNEIVIMIDQF